MIFILFRLSAKIVQGTLHYGFSIVDRNRKGEILLYIREDIPCKELKLHMHPHGIEGIFVEVNLRKIKWLLSAIHYPLSKVDEYFFDELGKSLNKYSQMYKTFLLIKNCNPLSANPTKWSNTLKQFVNFGRIV